MKIGTSLGKCVRSILAGEVKEEDVLFIVSNTMCPDLEKLNEVIEHYYYQYQGSHSPREYDMSEYSLEEAKALAQRLMENGKLHQPRVVGSQVWGNAHHLKDSWYDIVPSHTSDSESVREAWNHYAMIRSLAT